jgi:putative ABC transport system permease protein
VRKVSFRGLLARRMRLALTALSVALGVTLIAGTYVFTDTINASFDSIFQESYKSTDAVITPREPRDFSEEEGDELPPIPASVLERVKGVEGVDNAEGGIFADEATYIGKDDKELGEGFAPRFIASRLDDQRFNVITVADGRFPESDDEVAMLESNLEDAGLSVGDSIGVQGPRTELKDYEIVGSLKFGGIESFGGAVVGQFTLAEAQRLSGRDGFDEIDAAAVDGVDPSELKRRIRAALPADYVVRTGGEQAASQSKDIRDNLGFLRTALLVFAGISLFVGAFIIFNTFSITVAQRTREFALLRTLGATRRQVLGAVLGEGLTLGLLGAAVGLGLGIVLAQGLRELFNSLGVTLPSNGSVIATRTVVVSLLVGTLVTLLSSVIPAIRATRVPPIAALREGAVLPKGRGARFVFPLGLALTVLAVAMLCVGLFGGLESGPALGLAGGGAGLAFVGVALLSPRIVPRLAAIVAWPMERLWGLTLRLARENARRQPGRTAATAAALMVGVTLVAFASIFAASASTTFRGVFEDGLKAQAVVQNSQGFGTFPVGATKAVGQVDGVSDITPLRFTHARIAGEDRDIAGIDPRSFNRFYDAGPGSEALARLAPGKAVISKDLAEEADWTAGSTFDLRGAEGGTRTIEVIGVIDDDGLLSNDVTMANDEIAQTLRADRDAYVFVATDGNPEAVTKAVDDLLEQRFPQAEALTKEAWVDDQVAQLNQVLMLIYALLALSVIVALFGIVNTLVLSITERTRELGMLRAIGTSRRQVRAMIRAEAVITALIGGVLGVVMGSLLAVLVSRVVDDLDLHFPVFSVLVLLVLAGIAGVLAAVLPARRAARLDVLRALAYE